MNEIKNGGPAFPIPLQSGQSWQVMAPCDGMTLRDYFAAKAMEAMLTGHFSRYGHDEYWPRPDIACEAYVMADAMLKERGPE